MKIRPTDTVYLLWRGLILFYIVSHKSLSLKEDPEEIPLIVSKMNDCYAALCEALSGSKHSIASMYMLLKLCTYAEKYESKINITFKK